MARQRLTRIWVAAAVAALSIVCGTIAAARQEEPGSPRARTPVTFLQINDVYATSPVDGAGGLARVATLKRRLADAGRTPFLVLAGDFLSPSVASSVFKGALITGVKTITYHVPALKPGTYTFHCDVHPDSMKGTFVVTAGSG